MRILFLDLDTLRPDHLGCYGYHRNTSPNIDRIAAEGLRFTNYHCSDAPCLPSRAALFTGQFGIHNGIVGHGGTAADLRPRGKERDFSDSAGQDNLVAFLRSAGFRTITVSPFAERHGAWWFYAGFNEMYNSGKGGMESAEDVSPIALDWIARNARADNWFLHVNYWDPHTYYRAPREFGNPFSDDPPPSWLTETLLQEHRNMVGGHRSRELNSYNDRVPSKYFRQPGEIKTLEDWRRLIDGYDCGIRYMDEHIGRLFAALEQQGVMEDLVIIISSDHGENIGELGLYSEHATADGITPHIPMILRWPGGQKGQVDAGLHYNLDLAPTLADLLDRPPAKSWDGLSYAPAVLKGESAGRKYLVLGQCAHVCQRAVRFGPWVYTRTYHDGGYLFPDEMLFDLEKDPHELCDLANARPEICQEATSYLNEWHDEMMQTMPDAPDPLCTVMQEGGPYHFRGRLLSYCDFLRKTGRDWAIPELKKRHPEEFSN